METVVRHGRSLQRLLLQSLPFATQQVISSKQSTLGKFLCFPPTCFPIFHRVSRCRNLTPYLADTGGTVVTTPTEHGPVRVPLAMEIASPCRRQRQKGSGFPGGAARRGQLPLARTQSTCQPPNPRPHTGNYLKTYERGQYSRGRENPNSYSIRISRGAVPDTGQR